MFSRVRVRLLLYIEHRLGSLRRRLDPDDVLQEIGARAWRAVRGTRFAAQGDFDRWIAVIARDHLADLRRRHGALKRDIGREAELARRPGSSVASSSGGAALPAGPAHSETPSRIASTEESRRFVAAVLQRMTDLEREVLLARTVEGRKLGEIAERVGKRLGAVSMIESRAIRKLRNLVRCHLAHV
jgi:RNA polymerase sigma factor (sigma-70 family)